MNEIVGHCPVCNAPIYGRKVIPTDQWGNCPYAPVQFTCDCRQHLLARIDAETAAVLQYGPGGVTPAGPATGQSSPSPAA